jgi:hypothetical protein
MNALQAFLGAFGLALLQFSGVYTGVMVGKRTGFILFLFLVVSWQPLHFGDCLLA